MKPWIHAKNSVRKHGGKPEDYQDIHDFIDSTKEPPVAAALDEIVAELRDADRQERIELLIDFAKNLPALPPRLEAHKDASHRVEECQSPVYLFVELDDAGLVRLFADAPMNLRERMLTLPLAERIEFDGRADTLRFVGSGAVRRLRAGVVGFGLVMSGYFFWRAYL